MKKLVPLLFLVLVLALAPSVFAQDTVWDKAESQDYGTKVAGMLGRGAVNVTTCFVDVIVQTVEGTKEGPPFVGTLAGLGGGIACTALRATSGALDVGTFWVPGFNGFPVARSYSDCLDFEELETSSTAVYAPAPPTTGSARTVGKQERDAMEYVKK